jgi:hypothetical protein
VVLPYGTGADFGGLGLWTNWSRTRAYSAIRSVTQRHCLIFSLKHAFMTCLDASVISQNRPPGH